MPRDNKVAQFTALTPRERETLAHAADGLNNEEIAKEMTITPDGVSRTFARIYDKLAIDATPRAQRDESIRQYLTGKAFDDK